MTLPGKLFQKIRNNRFLFLILVCYFLIRFINLTQIPIFNDESMYLDWAWSAIHIPGHAFDSLLDAKQPWIVWVFGVFEYLIADPLLAGRTASVLIGSLTVLGTYVITKKMMNAQIAFIAALLYCVIPIFVFYDRQALMESAIAASSIWSFIALFNLLHKRSKTSGMLLGMILGIGFFIKTSAILCIIPAVAILMFEILKKKDLHLAKASLFSLISFCCLTYFLFVQPLFWLTIKTNSRYTFTMIELIHLPISPWISHLIGTVEISFTFLSPTVFICSVVGIFLMLKAKIKFRRLFLCFFGVALLLEVLLGKSQNQRYLMPFLPFLVIPAAFIVHKLWIGNLIKKICAVLIICVPLILTGIQIILPEQYILELAKVTQYSELTYIHGQTSGYGIREAMQYIRQRSTSSRPSLVFFALNAGNPENAVHLYSNMQPNLFAFFIDSKLFKGVETATCASSTYPAFFVTRTTELAGMDKFFTLEKSFPNPDGKYFVGIYTLKKECKGETISLSDFYQPAIDVMKKIK